MICNNLYLQRSEYVCKMQSLYLMQCTAGRLANSGYTNFGPPLAPPIHVKFPRNLFIRILELLGTQIRGPIVYRFVDMLFTGLWTNALISS